MSRPREYNRDDALNAAMNAFWKNGFERTSYPVLEAAMQMNRGSIYAAFGDKLSLFYESLDHYISQRNSRLQAGITDESKTLKQALKSFLDGVIDFHMGDGQFCGCMLANSAVELGPFDKEANKRIWNGFLGVHDILIERISAAQAAGEIGESENPEDLARFFINTLIGMRVTVRVHNDRAWLESVSKQALRIFN